MKIHLAGEDLELLPEKALYWPRRRILALSDVHLGKAESFQAFGIPIPSGAHREDLSQIDRILQRRDVEKVYILGDLVHNKKSWTEQVQKDLSDFLQKWNSIEWSLLLGNHEKGSKPYLEKLPLKLIEDDLLEAPFVFSHGHDNNSEEESPHFEIQGHVHPVVVLKEGSIRLRLPCFLIENQRLTLPSFGMLTGGHEILRGKNQRILAVTPETVFEVPGR